MDPYDFWNNEINAPKYILAPMVEYSELPWRVLSRRYGCQAAYSPMLHALHFGTSPKYRTKSFTTAPEDRPLFIQFCANNADTLLLATSYVKDRCNSIDINLGCPQNIARRGHYGAFLQDEWNVINEMVTRLRSTLNRKVAVSCKIRRFEEIDKTVEYAKMLEKAGCTFIGLHARTRDQKGHSCGMANWDHIKAVKEAINIPLIGNGNIQSGYDAKECLEYTGADAVMSAEGNLHNPALFKNIHPISWEIAREYLEIIILPHNRYRISPRQAKGHLYKLFHKVLAMPENRDLLTKLNRATCNERLYDFVACVKKRYDCDTKPIPISTLPVPPYLCQPNYRHTEPEGAAENAGPSTTKSKDMPADPSASTSASMSTESTSDAPTATTSGSGPPNDEQKRLKLDF